MKRIRGMPLSSNRRGRSGVAAVSAAAAATGIEKSAEGGAEDDAESEPEAEVACEEADECPHGGAGGRQDPDVAVLAQEITPRRYSGRRSLRTVRAAGGGGKEAVAGLATSH
jgi:hypothetical protein